ncbi:MAG: hypothetical protein Q4A60_06360 [Pasteurellaceae bacterium]|nr:hypothetical protein [Pasteurellaceae bacterium]
MNINNAQDLKAFMINEVLAEYAEMTGKPLEQIKKVFEWLPEFHNEVMAIVEEAAEKNGSEFSLRIFTKALKGGLE